MSSGIELRTEEANGSIRNRWEEKYIPFPPFIRSTVCTTYRARVQCWKWGERNEKREDRLEIDSEGEGFTKEAELKLTSLGFSNVHFSSG